METQNTPSKSPITVERLIAYLVVCSAFIVCTGVSLLWAYKTMLVSPTQTVSKADQQIDASYVNWAKVNELSEYATKTELFELHEALKEAAKEFGLVADAVQELQTIKQEVAQLRKETNEKLTSIQQTTVDTTNSVTRMRSEQAPLWKTTELRLDHTEKLLLAAQERISDVEANLKNLEAPKAAAPTGTVEQAPTEKATGASAVEIELAAKPEAVAATTTAPTSEIDENTFLELGPPKP